MNRGAFRAVGAIAAAAVLAVALWILSSPDPARRPDADPDAPATRPRGESGEAAEAREAAPAGVRRYADLAPGTFETPDFKPRPVPAQEVPTIPGVCVLEDGTPLAGVSIYEPVVEVEQGKFIPEPTSTSVDGKFVVPADRALAFLHRWATVVSVEGGTIDAIAGQVDTVATVRPGTAAREMRVVFRDRPGMAHVRLFDSSTHAPITDLRGLRLSYVFGGDLSGRAVYDFPGDTGLGGWIPVREGELPEDLAVQADPGTVVVEFAASGYAPARVGLLSIRGRMSVGVEPIAPCVTGTIVRAKDDPNRLFENQPVEASLRVQDGQPPQDLNGVRGLPTVIGPFRLDDLPHGAFVLEVADVRYAAQRRAKRSFEYRGSPVDLGEISFTMGASIYASVRDPDGKPIPQARVVIVREGEDPEKGRVLPPDQDGRVGLTDLEPGVPHRVVALGLPRPLEKRVSSGTDGKRVDVELAWPERLVPCRIALIVDGKAVANPDGSRTIPATVHESPLPRESGAWHRDGTFEASLVPGAYRFSVYATPEGGGDLVLFAGEVTVPAGDSFETRVELTREGR